MEETQMVIFDIVEKLLKKTGIRPSEVRSQLPLRSPGGNRRDHMISHQSIVLFPHPILSKHLYMLGGNELATSECLSCLLLQSGPANGGATLSKVQNPLS